MENEEQPNLIQSLISKVSGKEVGATFGEIGFGTGLDIATSGLLAAPIPGSRIAYGGINFLGGAGANYVAQQARTEEDLEWYDRDWGEIISSGLLGIIPGMSGKAGKLTRFVGNPNTYRRAATFGAASGIGDQFIRQGINEGRLPTSGEIATGGITGSVAGPVFKKSFDEIGKIFTKYQGKSAEEINTLMTDRERSNISYFKKQIVANRDNPKAALELIERMKESNFNYRKNVLGLHGNFKDYATFKDSKDQIVNSINEKIDDGYIEEIVEQGDDVIFPPGSVEADIQANTQAMASDDINRLQYKADNEHNDYVKLQLKEWGMEDGVFRLDTFFSKVRKDPTTGKQQKSSDQGRKFIELFLTPKDLMEDFNKLRSDTQGDHQIFKSRFVDMLEKRGLDPSLVNYHHIAGLYDALPLYEGLTYGSDEWWDLTALLLERNIRPGASGFKEKTNFMSILGMAQQQGQKGKDAMPHGVAHLFYKDELGAQRTFNKENDLFFSKKEVDEIRKKGNYRDPTTGEMHNSYREFKAKKWADIVNYSEDIAIEAMKQWEAVNPKGNMDFTELVDYLNTLDDQGKLSRIDGKYQVPLIPKIIEEITEAQEELEHLDPISDTYKAALVSRLLDMNLPQEFINSYVKKVAPGGNFVSIEKLSEGVKKLKISKPRGKKKKYKK